MVILLQKASSRSNSFSSIPISILSETVGKAKARKKGDERRRRVEGSRDRGCRMGGCSKWVDGVNREYGRIEAREREGDFLRGRQSKICSEGMRLADRVLPFNFYYLLNILVAMSMRLPKNQTSSFKNTRGSELRNSSQKFGYSPDKSESRIDRTETYGVRFRRKDLREFQPELYITGTLTYQDVIDLKEVFDAYDSTGMGVLLPNDLKLLLTQNGFEPNRKTTYEIVAEFDAEETGGISFIEFMKAMDTKPFRNETKKEIAAIFKKYDRDNKNYLTLDDFREINGHVKENLDEETLKLMLEKADSNKDGKVSFEDFYSVMVKDIY